MSFIQELGKKHMPRTMNFFQLWDEILTAYVFRNSSERGEVRNKNMYADLIGYYSDEDYVTYIYSIDGYPTELENSYRTTLRRECLPGVRMSFITQFEKHTIEWGSPQMRAKLKTWKIIEENGEEVDEYNLHKNLKTLDIQDWKKDSLVYLSTAELRRKRKMFKVRGVMLISGERGYNFDSTVKEVVKLCKLMGIKITRVTADVPEYLKVFSPFSNIYDTRVLNQCGSVVLPDELIARFSTYSQGVVGKEGIVWGTDIFSNFACMKKIKQTTESAENWLITAETGGGKSYMVKFIISQILAEPEFNGTIMDVEGFEYIPLLNYISHNDLCTLINMAEGSGNYYDPVEIYMTGDEKLDTDMYALSSSFTLSLFKCLLGNSGDIDEWADIVITDAVALTYSKAGVDQTNPNTWKLSRGLTLYSVYDTLKTLKTNGDVGRAVSAMTANSLYEERLGVGTRMSRNDVTRLVMGNEDYQKAIDLCIAKTSRYFEKGGVRASVFRNRIVLEDIINSKLVVCSFGMAGKSENSVDPIQMALMQLYASNISHIRSIFSKHAGKFNFKLWEEFQRWGGFPDADKTINVALTGGRKLGDVNIIITNKVRDMLEDDKFGVFSNITSIAVGAIGDAKVRHNLCSRLSIPQMEQELDAIAYNNKDLSAYIDGDTLTKNPYMKAFLIGLDRTIYTISRVSLPDSLRKSDIFRTGIDLKH